MVVVRLAGGLGNQMFQYAAGRTLALRCEAELKLDLSEFDLDKRRHYQLDALPIRATSAREDELAALGIDPKGRQSFLARLRRYQQASSRSRRRFIYREPYFHYDPRVAGLRPPIYLDGYWQSERYFADFSETLRKELTPAIPHDDGNAALMAQIDAANAVSLHVRRGDYASDPTTNRYHGTCSLEYYQCAVEYIAARTEAPHFFIFSDTPEWARRNLQFRHAATFVTANSAEVGHLDMGLMSRCRHHILANSSFSWWGAWLNPSAGKIVVAPRRWFDAGPSDTEDLVPSAWIRL